MRTQIKVNVPIIDRLGRGTKWLEGLSRLSSPSGRQRINRAMAQKFIEITRQNFGAAGLHRAKEWAPLSPDYQKRIGYSGPPKLVLRGTLLSSLRVDSSSPSHAVAFSRDPKASLHQHGTRNMPARPPFPVHQGRLTPYAERELIRAATTQIGAMLRA